MVDLAVLEKHGITVDELRKKFTSDKKSDELDAFIKRVAARVQDGMNNNFDQHKFYHAIDQAWDTPFRQITPTLVQTLGAGKMNPEQATAAAIKWGLTHLLEDKKDPKTGKVIDGQKTLNLPTFFKIVVPLVRSYVTIRWAKLFNDRNLTPYHKYEPLISTPEDRARCEILTSRMQTMATQLGYSAIGQQVTLKMLLYATQLKFIQEEWFKETQTHTDEAGNEQEEITKEGLRYHLPHPTRTYWDRSQPLSSLNTDTGVSFCGYWRVHNYRWVREQKSFWNTERIAFSTCDWGAKNQTFFSTCYGSCRMQFPQSTSTWTDSTDREDNIARTFYSSTFDDSAVVVTEHFEKCIPSECGLGDYDNPVWFRLVVASDHTVVYCAPLPAAPSTYWGYDSDESRSINASLALEIMPFQDHVSNLLTQTLLSTKQNLANLTFIDSDIVDDKAVRLIEGDGESQYRKLNCITISNRKLRTQQSNIKDAVASVRFPQLDTQGTITAITTVLNILERVLVMSAMEAAAAATHEQTAEEVRNINQTTSTRVQFTGTGLDRGHDAWKRQLYAYTMAYGSEEIFAALPNDGRALDCETLKALGFTVKHEAKNPMDRHFVTGNKKCLKNKTALQLEYFASTREFSDRANNPAMAAQMVQMLGVALGNQVMAQSIGPEQAITLMNHVMETMGFPRDFKLTFSGQTADRTQQQLLLLAQQVRKLVEDSSKAVLDQVGKALQPITQAIVPLQDATKALTAETHQNTVNIAKITEVLSHANADISQPPPPQSPPPPVYDNAPIPASNGPGGQQAQVLALPAGMPDPAQSSVVPVGATPA